MPNQEGHQYVTLAVEEDKVDMEVAAMSHREFKELVEHPATRMEAELNSAREEIKQLEHNGNGVRNVYYGVRKVYHGVMKVYHGVRNVYHGVSKVYHGVRKVCHGDRKVNHGVRNICHGHGRSGLLMGFPKTYHP